MIGIVGAGGIGSYYAGLLGRAGQPVRLLARGNHLAAIQARGLEVRVPDGSFMVALEATSDERGLIGCQYVLVSVKGYSLPDVAPGLVAAAKAGSTIVPLLNGIDITERLVALGVSAESIVGGFVRASVARVEPGVVERKSGFDLIVIGELDRATRPRTSTLGDLLASAGITSRVSEDIVLDQWRKFAFIVPMSVVCGLSRQPMGPVLATDRGRTWLSDALHEVVMVSQGAPGALSASDEQTIRGELFGMPAPIKPSFLLDLERGGETELDLLAATVSRLGKARGVPTPIHDVATAAFEAATHPRS